ncbi:MAG: zf-HC2 domain-containing protein, partial [Pseudomonadales bacterium]
MTCPSALTCSLYADGALQPEEAGAVKHHLGGCASCRETVAGLAAESRALRAAMQAAEVNGVIPVFVPRPTIPRLLSWIGFVALAAWAVNVAWMSLASTSVLPDWLGWFAPDAADLGIEFFIGLLVGLVVGSGDLLTDVLQIAGNIALITVGFVGVWVLARRKTARATSLCMAIALTSTLMFLTPSTHAFELRRDEDRVTIPAGETIDDTLIVSAEIVVVEGDVTGDLIALGEQVSILGRVGGSLLVLAESINVEGDVAGSVLGAGKTVDIRGGSLGGSLYSVGSAVTVHRDTRIAGSAALVGKGVEMHGAVDRDLLALSRHLSLFGNVERGLRAYGERVDLAATAHVGGDLNATLRREEDLNVAPGAVVYGETNLQTWPEHPSR